MIRNIIFDFGGVLLNLDFERSFRAFEKLGYGNFDRMFSQHRANDFFQQLETGKIRPEEFYKKFPETAQGKPSAAQIENAWNAMLVSYRKESLRFLTEIKGRRNLYLLSNTNEIHYHCFSTMLRAETHYHCLEDFFLKAWYSHRIGRRKPDVETFEFVLNDAGIHAAETLFIDDSFSNLPPAQALGMKTHLLTPDERIEQLNYDAF